MLFSVSGEQQGGTENGEGDNEKFSEFKSDSSSHFYDLLFFFYYILVFVCFLLSGFVVGDRLGENADDHGQKTENSEDDGAGHGFPSFPFSGSFSLLSIK